MVVAAVVGCEGLLEQQLSDCTVLRLRFDASWWWWVDSLEPSSGGGMFAVVYYDFLNKNALALRERVFVWIHI